MRVKRWIHSTSAPRHSAHAQPPPALSRPGAFAEARARQRRKWRHLPGLATVTMVTGRRWGEVKAQAAPAPQGAAPRGSPRVPALPSEPWGCQNPRWGGAWPRCPCQPSPGPAEASSHHLRPRRRGSARPPPWVTKCSSLLRSSIRSPSGRATIWSRLTPWSPCSSCSCSMMCWGRLTRR